MNNYQLNDEIGKGRFSVVYKGRRRKTTDYYAIYSIEKSRRPYVLNSVSVLRSIDHRNVIKFHTWYETNNHLWVIAEYCTGGDLRSILASHIRMTEMSVRLYGGDIADALLQVHSMGILYNDLKPSRFLLDSTASLRFFNFSLACSFAQAASHAPVGTPSYMAPEWFLADTVVPSVASDLWSLGCVLYELATGHPPFTGATLTELLTNIFNATPKPVSDAGDAFNTLVMRLLEKHPLRRAAWPEVVEHPFWKGRLRMPADGMPAHAAFEEYRQTHGATPWTERQVRDAIRDAVRSAEHNARHHPHASEEGGSGELAGNVEIDFSPPLASEYEVHSLLSSEESLREGEPAKAAASTAAPNVITAGAGAKREAAPHHSARGASGTQVASTRRRGAAGATTHERRSITSSNKETESPLSEAQLKDFGGRMITKVVLKDLLHHNSDVHIRPLCMNKHIEYIEEPTYEASKLPFQPYTLEDFKNLNETQLTEYVKVIYQPLASTTTSAEEKLNLLHYVETISVDATVANVLVNSSVMTLCVKFVGQQSSAPIFRVAAASVMGHLMRFTTFISAELTNNGIIPNILKLFRLEDDTLVKRRLLVCVGEFLFYIAVQPAKEHRQHGIVPEDVRSTYQYALQCSDDVIVHYAARTIENLASVQEKYFARHIFGTPEVVELLLAVHAQMPKEPRHALVRSTLLSAAMKLAIADEALVHFILTSPYFSVKLCVDALRASSAIRTAQKLLTFLNVAMVKSLVALSSSYTTLWAGTTANTADSALLTQSSLRPEEADEVLGIIADIADEVLMNLSRYIERASAVTHGKTLVFVMLLGCLGGITLARLCTASSVAFLDRLQRGANAYTQKCAKALQCILSVFLSEKMGHVARRVMSISTPVYLAATQQLLGAPTIRDSVQLQEDFFQNLGECIAKSMTNSLYGAYENNLTNIAERVVQQSDAVLRYQDCICAHLVHPFTDMLQRKESERHFTSLRFLIAMMTPMASQEALASDDTRPAAAAVQCIVDVVTEALPVLLAANSPIPAHTFRLLATCGERKPSCLETMASRAALGHILSYMKNTAESDLQYPLAVLTTILKGTPSGDVLVVFAVKQKLPSLLIEALVSEKGLSDRHIEASCCDLAALALEHATSERDSRAAQECLQLLEHDSLRAIFLPLCAQSNCSTAASAAAVVCHLVQLSPAAQKEMMSPEGIDLVTEALKSLNTNSCAADVATAKLLLQAVRYAIEGQEIQCSQTSSYERRLISAVEAIKTQRSAKILATDIKKLLSLMKA